MYFQIIQSTIDTVGKKKGSFSVLQSVWTDFKRMAANLSYDRQQQYYTLSVFTVN